MEIVATAGPHKYLPWKPTLLLPVGDLQYDGKKGACDLPRLRRFLEWGMEHEAWFIGMGDFVDFLSPSNRSRLKMAGLYDTAEQVIDDAATGLEEELMEVLRPTKGRWLGLLQGHHYYVHLSGGTSDTYFAHALAAPFLGDCAVLRLTFKDADSSNCAVLKVWAHHGHHGGADALTALRRLRTKKADWPDVRLFLQGHIPALGHVKTDSLDIPNKGTPNIFHADTTYALTGGFSRSYQQGSHFAGRPQGGYAEKAMMAPAVMGGQVITLTPEKVHRGSIWHRQIDVKASS